MEDSNLLHMTALDSITAGDLQIIKAAIPYINVSEQKFISIYVKMIELTKTIDFFNKATENDMEACSLNAEAESPLDMLNDIRTYCNEKQRETIDLCINFMSAMELYNTFASSMENSEDGQSSNSFDAIRSFLSPEQQAMFETYSSMMDL